MNTYLINTKTRAIRIADMPVRLNGIEPESIVDGPGLRYAIFTQGCPHRCPGCHNESSHDIGGGYMSSTARIWAEIIRNPNLDGVTFSGGEPFLWGRELAELGRAARDAGLDVIVYTGYELSELLEMAETDPGVYSLLRAANYVKTGRYIESLRNLELRFRGSENQRIYDVTCYPNSKNIRQTEL